MTTAKNRILIMAGGTGGHIFPGIAVADCLQTRGWDIHWLGTADRMEAEIIPAHGFTMHFIKVTGLRGRGIMAKLHSLKALVTAIFNARKLIQQLQPQVVLGMGGYASGPGGIAAKLSGTPLLIHEQNAVMGMTNQWLAKLAQKVLLGFSTAIPGVKREKVVVTGNPVRAKITQLPKRTNHDNQSPLKILIVGGSLGARPFNQLLPAILTDIDGISIRHQTGKGNARDVIAEYQQYNRTIDSDLLEVSEFIEDISAAYQWADLVICRAGAITVTEVALAGIAAVFIPLPHAVDDHQTKNAQTLVERRAAYLVQQHTMNETLPRLLQDICHNPAQLNQIRLNALDCAMGEAAETVASLCEQYAKERL